MASTDRSFLDRVFAAKDQEESRKLYDQWASSYDEDMKVYSFTAHLIVAKLAHKHFTISPADATVIDAGCGSGSVGAELARLGFSIIDGLDLSEGMLKRAGTIGVYRTLKIADLTQQIDAEDGAYDVLTCSGTFTHGHLGPEPLPEFTRVIKTGGILVFTVLEQFWKERNFEKIVKKLEDEGVVQVLEKDTHNYRKLGEEESGGLVVVLRKL